MALLTVFITSHELTFVLRKLMVDVGIYFKGMLFVPSEICMRWERALLKLLHQTDGFSESCLRNVELLIKLT